MHARFHSLIHDRAYFCAGKHRGARAGTRATLSSYISNRKISFIFRRENVAGRHEREPRIPFVLKPVLSFRRNYGSLGTKRGYLPSHISQG